MRRVRNIYDFFFKKSEKGNDTNSFNTYYEWYSTYQSVGTTLD